MIIRIRLIPGGVATERTCGRVVKPIGTEGREARAVLVLVALGAGSARRRATRGLVGPVRAAGRERSAAFGMLVAVPIARTRQVALARLEAPSAATDVGVVVPAVGVPAVTGVPTLALAVAVRARLPVRPVPTSRVPTPSVPASRIPASPVPTPSAPTSPIPAFPTSPAVHFVKVSGPGS